MEELSVMLDMAMIEKIERNRNKQLDEQAIREELTMDASLFVSLIDLK